MIFLNVGRGLRHDGQITEHAGHLVVSVQLSLLARTSVDEVILRPFGELTKFAHSPWFLRVEMAFMLR